MESRAQVERLLEGVRRGDAGATDQLLPVVYDELRRIARGRLAREGARSTQPTSLVHEAYMRLVGDREVRWDSRAHFFGAAAEAMRRIRIEKARARSRTKRGGGQKPVTLNDDAARLDPPDAEMLVLDDALSHLEKLDPAMSNVVKLRFFAGLTVPETADALGVSPRSVNRMWTAARAWLQDAIANGPPPAGG